MALGLVPKAKEVASPSGDLDYSCVLCDKLVGFGSLVVSS